MPKDTLVRVQLTDNNLGAHPIYGPVTKIYYGYRAHGDYFRVHAADAERMTGSGLWTITGDTPTGDTPVTPENPTTPAETAGAGEGDVSDAVVEEEEPAPKKRGKK